MFYESRSVLSPSSENSGAFCEVGAEVPGWLGRSRYLHAATPAWASTAEVHGGVARPSQLPFHKTDLDWKRSNSYIWAKSYQKMHLNSSSVQPLPMQLPWLGKPRAQSIVKYLQPESLKAEFQCLSPRSSAPTEGDFLSWWYFPDKLTKDLFNFFF